MKVLVTLGGTREKIDDVRYIGNSSTGALGKAIAEEFSSRGDSVVALCAGYCEKPAGCCIHEFVSYADFERLFRSELENNFDIVIHAAAVADYTVKNQVDGKLDSGEEVAIKLEPTAKLINLVKQISPTTKLVGFKLLAGVNKDELLKTAKKNLEKSKSDIIVANRMEDVSPDAHVAYIVTQDDVKKCSSKEKIARILGEIL
ncbi:phosphopantothenoylcysteine decarboxylase domain-containing protein [Treponema sp. R6D11]